MRIRVIGLGNQQPAEAFMDELRSDPVLARDGAAAVRWLQDEPVEVTDLAPVFDHQDVPSILERLDAAFREDTSSSATATYLVPGAGAIGDESVRFLAERHELEIVPGAIGVSVLGSVQFIDALELATAEACYPFDAGLAEFDPTIALVVANVRGRTVVELAHRRLERLLGEPPPAADDGTIVIDGRSKPAESSAFEGLAQIVSILRSPEGCPWDRDQTAESLLPLMLEEIEEFRIAWLEEEPEDQADELGDVLVHVVMLAQIARESGRFTISDALRAASAKMLRRHPHVFGDEEVESYEDLHRIWNQVKASERAAKRGRRGAS